MAGQIRKDEINRGRDHGRPRRQTIKAVGEIYRVRGPDNDKDRKDHIKPAQIGANILEKRHT